METVLSGSQNDRPAPMTPMRRARLLKVLNDARNPNATLPYLYYFDRLEQCDLILNWLVDNGITGRLFEEWVAERKFVPMAAANHIMSKLHRLMR
jgi:hypothetical protein